MLDDGKFHVIPSVRSIRYLEKALEGKEEWVLLSCIHIGNLQQVVLRCHQAGKKVIVNHEIVGGLGTDRTAFKLLKDMFLVDGVMGSSGTKLGMVKKEHMMTIRRVALEDSLAVEQIMGSLNDTKVDIIELRPAYYAIKYLDKLKNENSCKYIAGGFVDTKEMMDAVYTVGFLGASTSSVDLWGYSPEKGLKV